MDYKTVSAGDLIDYSAGGGWGKENEQGDYSIKVAIIRGADFPAIERGDQVDLPMRWEKQSKVSKATLKCGDIILEISGGTDNRPTGRTIYVTDELLNQYDCPVIPASFCRLIRPGAQVKSDYLYFWLQDMYAKGRTWGYQNRSTGISNFQYKVFAETEQVAVPNKVIQQKIAALLSAIESKKRINNRINDYLTTLRDTLVRQEISDALDQGTGSWQEIPIKQVAEIASGYSYKSAELVYSSPTGLIGIKNFNRNGSFRDKGFKPIQPKNAKLTQYVVLGDIVVAHTDLTQNADIIGRAIQVLDLGGFEQAIASCDVVKVTSIDSSISNEFLAALLATEDFHRHCLSYVNGTTVLHLSKKALPEYLLKIPTDSGLMSRLDSTFKAIAHKQTFLIRENRYLGQLRNSLLPKLISGEIDVSKIEVPTQLNNHLCSC